MARLAASGEPTLTPVRNGPGRHTDELRVYWIAQVRATEDGAELLRTLAICSASLNNPTGATSALKRAEALLFDGPDAAAAKPMNQETVMAEWSKITGKDYNDPATQELIVETVAKMAKARLEKEGRRATARTKTTRKGQSKTPPKRRT